MGLPSCYEVSPKLGMFLMVLGGLYEGFNYYTDINSVFIYKKSCYGCPERNKTLDKGTLLIRIDFLLKMTDSDLEDSPWC